MAMAAAAHERRLPSADSTLIFTVLVGGLQLAIVLLYCFGADYGEDAAAGSTTTTPGQTAVSYAMFQDVNAMMYLGFGFLMSFMSRYTWTALGATYLIAAVTVQWNMLVAHFWHDLVAHGTVSKLALSIETLTTGNFGVAAVLISFGAIIGRVSPTQMITMAIFEIIVYGLNEAIGVVIFKAVDMGGSMYVHIFGAFFGVAVSYMIGSAKHLGRKSSRHDEAMTSKHASTFAMIGTLLLWIYWPSFNGALATGASQHRVVINTTLSLCGSCVAAFIGSRLLRGGKFSMEDIQNATLAGGVAIGSSADLVVLPGPAIIVGIVAGIVSVTGFAVISPFLSRTFDLDDTCSVFSLHGMPGLIGGAAGAISAAVATTANYGNDVVTVFPARADGRTASGQASFQTAALFVSLGMAIAGGLITGAILKLRVLGPLDAGAPMSAGVGLYEDERIWDMEDIEFSDPNAPYVDTAPAPHHHAHSESHQALASASAVDHIEMSEAPMKRPAAAAATTAASNGDGNAEVAAV